MAMRILKIIGITFVVLLIVGLFAWNNWSLSQQLGKQIEERLKAQNTLNSESVRLNELSEKLALYSPHEQLVRTIISRDQAADSLWDWLGRQVYLKSDSTGARKWVVTGVFFGGGRFDHRIWCEVTKDDIVRNVNPEIIRP